MMDSKCSHYALYDRGALKEGETLVVLGASGGVVPPPLDFKICNRGIDLQINPSISNHRFVYVKHSLLESGGTVSPCPTSTVLVFFFFLALVTGPRRSLSLKLSDRLTYTRGSSKEDETLVVLGASAAVVPPPPGPEFLGFAPGRQPTVLALPPRPKHRSCEHTIRGHKPCTIRGRTP